MMQLLGCWTTISASINCSLFLVKTLPASRSFRVRTSDRSRLLWTKWRASSRSAPSTCWGLGRAAPSIRNRNVYAAQLAKRALAIAEQLQGCTIIGLQEAGTPEDAANLSAPAG